LFLGFEFQAFRFGDPVRGIALCNTGQYGAALRETLQRCVVLGRAASFSCTPGVIPHTRRGILDGGSLLCKVGLPGQEVWAGARHDWNILTGTMDSSVLDWLRKDECLTVGSGRFSTLDVSFAPERANINTKTEENRKFILAGSLSGGSCSGALCGLSLTMPLPVARLQAWVRAFKFANKAPLR
jgi:hypothetical protein